MSEFIIERLDASVHAREDFDCGVAPLNDFLKRFSGQQERAGVTRVFVMVKSAERTRVLGYYALGAASFEAMRLPSSLTKRLPRYPVPAIRLGRLAVEQTLAGKGLGSLLLADAYQRAKLVTDQVGVHSLIVDAKDEAAANFYEKFGFRRFEDAPMTLFMALGSWR